MTTPGPRFARAVLVVITLLISALATAPHPSYATSEARPLVLVVGDSISLGTGATPGYTYSEVMARYCDFDCAVRNVSHGGLCLMTYGCGYKKRLIDIFDDELIRKRPQLIVVGVGRNDLCHATNSQLQRGMKRLKKRATRAHIPILFNTIAPRGVRYEDWPCEEQRSELNAWMKRRLATNDLDSLLGNPQTNLLQSRYDSGDGLHLNTLAHEQIATFLYRYTVDLLDLPHVAVAAPHPPLGS